MREIVVAIEHRCVRVSAAELCLVTTIGPLVDGPHVNLVHALTTVEGVTCPAAALATESLLGGVPAGLPSLQVGVAVEGHRAGRRDAAQTLGLAAVRGLLHAPAVRLALLAVELVAADIGGEAAVSLLLVGPADLPRVPACDAVERGVWCSAQRRLCCWAPHALLRATPSALGDGPSGSPICVTVLAIVGLASRAVAATMRLFGIVPSLLPSVGANIAVEYHFP
mmetsp:Transcript_62459/g.181083  ORF Transcript_62459/g.181083 Transcript_62459/m.181083 type:complete len:224 (-) Transcript_62459:1209-1880(-)